MAYDADGKWSAEDDSVSSNVDKLQSQDSALMRKAVGDSNKAMNRRGMLNSSIATGAGIGAGLGAVVPIASQEASQNLAKNQQAQADTLSRETRDATIASQDRSSYMSALATMQGNYIQGIGATLADRKLAASTRSAAQRDMAALFTTGQQQLGSLYNVTLNWGTS